MIWESRPINWNALLSFSNIPKDIQLHLKNVYATLAMGLLTAATGAYMHILYNFMQASILTSLLSLGLMLAIFFIPHRRENIPTRMLCFLGAAFCMGIGLGPLLSHVKDIDPSIIPSAFMGTAVIFISFTLSALWSKRRSFLFLGGILMSGLLLLSIGSFVNIFMRSQIVFTAELYLGLAVFSLLVLFDTQLIVEKRRLGDDDFIWHSFDLFLDIINIFRHLMVILARRDRRRNDD
jgi:Bax inhibitor 1